MATNKHATIRYHALDQCFSNSGRRYYIDDLIEACNSALLEYTGLSDGIKRRQVFEDIKFMESEQGWAILLDRIKDGKKVYYRYAEKSYSIKKQAINETEVKQLQETLSILNRFKGMPQFEWMEEMLIRIESTFKLKGNSTAVVGFEQNPYLKGLNYFTELFNAIQYKKVLRVKYQSFKQTKPVDYILHPYFLKQYNNRWFLFGYNEAFSSISNLSLDRIIEIKELKNTFIDNASIKFEEYFDDIVGVTVKDNEPVEKILLKISNDLWPYVESKPIHGSQIVKEINENYVVIELNLKVNYEFISLIFALGEQLKVIQPESLKTALISKANNLIKNYF
jgi:predicted DNA-binding transcriptional regulator YafY